MKGKIIILALSALAILGCKKKVNPTPEPTAREIALEDYNTNYLGSAVSDPGWTGSTVTCNAGTLPQTTHDKVIQRINYFRRMVGLNDNTTLVIRKMDIQALQQAILLWGRTLPMPLHYLLMILGQVIPVLVTADGYYTQQKLNLVMVVQIHLCH
jgi:hypothetical protein